MLGAIRYGAKRESWPLCFVQSDYCIRVSRRFVIPNDVQVRQSVNRDTECFILLPKSRNRKKCYLGEALLMLDVESNIG